MANLGTWDGETEIHQGDIVLVTDADAGPYEATVELIDGPWARLCLHAFAGERDAPVPTSVVDEVWARQTHPLDGDEAMELAYEELAALRAERDEVGDA